MVKQVKSMYCNNSPASSFQSCESHLGAIAWFSLHASLHGFAPPNLQTSWTRSYLGETANFY